jgi:hypothetical protein
LFVAELAVPIRECAAIRACPQPYRF